jgi:hypothetical protein
MAEALSNQENVRKTVPGTFSYPEPLVIQKTIGIFSEVREKTATPYQKNL